jgi:hypothetical protein
MLETLEKKGTYPPDEREVEMEFRQKPGAK